MSDTEKGVSPREPTSRLKRRQRTNPDGFLDDQFFDPFAGC